MAWTFGEAPLAETTELAAVIRRLSGLVLSLEAADPEVRRLTEQLLDAERTLAAAAPTSAAPRVGAQADGDGRVYLDHSRHIGAFNPVFPVYELTVDGDRAVGSVTFPLLYEGPPGFVHGGFLAVLFDTVIQHHNCDVGVAGKTTQLQVWFRRPTPLLTSLDVEVRRQRRGDRIVSTAKLGRGDQVCAEATMEAIAGDRAALPAVSRRRTGP